MNCFQKLLSSWWRTTNGTFRRTTNWLWIAFKNYYLRDEEQHLCSISVKPLGCELLSKIIIFVMKNNNRCERPNKTVVVNCFQKLLSSWWRTTEELEAKLQELLWIAFKNYYLRDEEQQNHTKRIENSCCELLSKIIIFVMKNNMKG